MTNSYRALMEKVDNTQEQMGNISTEMKSGETRKSQKGNARNKNALTEMKNAFDEFISRLNIAEERINEYKCHNPKRKI